MAVATEPEPARLPLAGGRNGATVRVHPLCTGEILLPPRAFDRPTGAFAKTRGKGRHLPRSRWRWAPVPAFLVEHPSAGPILVDSGLHASVAIDPRISLGRRQPRSLPVRVRAEQALPAQLRARGVGPEEIATVVMTHLHHDHASGIPQFPNAMFVVTCLEWRIACNGGFRQGYRHAHFDHPYDWRTVDYAAPETGGHGSFNRAVDLFGDGTVRLLFTPGHTRGHQSVLLRLNKGELLLTGDAAYTQRTIDDGLVPIFCADQHLYRRSLREIQDHVASRPGAVVICGHDAERWPQLQPVYA
ncbi:MAG: N-acyl homoserine lactone hydrolase [Solirubrobacteraceae bacterium]|jgi:glyoxylase-like metal-dependent hydrolase (beta-lactamase superfamily II)|nr:N-acyl homoserine lactone hydrolase [Solirubrobacteraceae bacterium]MEA2382447.1 N-acyl homoserine lactone hydrolase [Solirubrobacteraceae bacterium]